MRLLSFTFQDKVIRRFQSLPRFVSYMMDILIRGGLLVFFISVGLLPHIITNADASLSRYIGMYSIAFISWALVLVKFLFFGKNTFTKTRFDLYFMGILAIALISVLLSLDKVGGFFGSPEMRVFSILTLLSISIIYYILVTLFAYGRGIKWLNMGFVLMTLVASIYYTVRLQQGVKWDIDFGYLSLVTLSIPLLINTLFLFRRLFFRVLGAVALFFNVILVSAYSEYLEGGMFVLGGGVLALFLLFYFSFWIKSSEYVYAFLRYIRDNIRDVSKLKKAFSQERKGGVLLLMMVFIALWILGIGSMVWGYFHNNLRDVVFGSLGDSFEQLDGFRGWMLGSGDLSSSYSSITVVNFLVTYGMPATVLALVFGGYSAYSMGKLTLKMLYSASWRTVILVSSLFVTWICLIITALTTSISSVLVILGVFVLTVHVIVGQLVKRDNYYQLIEEFVTKDRRSLVIKVLFAIIILVISLSGVINFLTGAGGRLF